MIGSILTTLGLPALINIVRKALSFSSNSKVQVAVSALDEVSKAISNNDITLEELQELHRHAEQMAVIEKEISVATISAVNETIRQELEGSDGFIRRWRALFGYAVAGIWTLMMLLVVIVLFSNPMYASEVVMAVIDTTPLWMIALAILGVTTITPTSIKGGIRKLVQK